jgi:uncharacterized protein
MKVTVAGEVLELLPERAVLWPARRVLLLADVHVGKVEAFQRHGVALPSEFGVAELERLSTLVEREAVQAVWVLGDLLHTAVDSELAPLTSLLAQHPTVEFHLVLGNHDRRLPAPERLGLQVHPAAVPVGPFMLCHEPARHSSHYVLAGHLHPMVRLRSGGDSLRLPCFQFQDSLGLLPAFTEFSGGLPVNRRQGRTFAITDGEVVEV